jgi:hypothetical protein
VAGLTWTSWRSDAFGRGVLKVNDCTPTCAQGRYVKYPILVVLWRPRPWPGHPGRATERVAPSSGASSTKGKPGGFATRSGRIQPAHGLITSRSRRRVRRRDPL